MRRGHGLPEEDGLLDGSLQHAAQGVGEAVRLRVAVLAPPHISNLDEFLPLARVPGLRLVWARRPAQLEGADWIVLPGSKQVSGDLAWLRARGMDVAIQRHAARGGAVLGVCGGLQMLGLSLHDPQGHDGQAVHDLPGLGLLPVHTHFGPGKQLLDGAVAFGATHGSWAGLAGVHAQGYQNPLWRNRCRSRMRCAARRTWSRHRLAAGQRAGRLCPRPVRIPWRAAGLVRRHRAHVARRLRNLGRSGRSPPGAWSAGPLAWTIGCMKLPRAAPIAALSDANGADEPQRGH
jgi:hypothetical protein